MRKRGQVTVFIVLGIVLVALAFLGVYFKDELAGLFGVERELVVPEQAKEIYEYVSSCIDTSFKDSISVLGLQGGYITIPPPDLPKSIVNPFSNSLEVLRGFDVPYWLYKQENTVLKTKVPSLKNMEQGLEQDIEKRTVQCINNFSLANFKKYTITPLTMRADISLKEKNVELTVTYPLHLEIGTLKYDFKEFRKTLDVNLKELYEKARALFDNELKTKFLEEKTMDMMIAYEEIPYSGIEETCAPLIWEKQQVIQDFKRILATNIPFLKVEDAAFKLADDAHDYFVLEGISGDFKNTNVNFQTFESWPMKIEVQPSDDGVLKSQEITGNFGDLNKDIAIVKSFLCMNSYTFVYDVQYPVLISVSNPSALNGEGYTFQFATLVIIEKNQPRTAEVRPLEVNELDNRYCTVLNKPVTVFTSRKNLDGSIEPLENVEISYKCINHLCEGGISAIEEGIATLETNLPSCKDGYLVAQKEGFHQKQLPFSTVDENTATIVLNPYILKDISAFVDRSKTADSSQDLKPGEQLTIHMNNEEDSYAVVALYPNEKRIKLVPGAYAVKIYLTTTAPKKITIPEKKVETCFDIPKKGVLGVFGVKEKECVQTVIPSITLDNVLLGYEEYNLTITEADLSKDLAVFGIHALPTPETIEDVSEIYLSPGVKPIVASFVDKNER